MMLSMRVTCPIAVEHAEAAVYILDTNIRERVLPEAFPQGQLELARELLQEARDRKAAKTEKSNSASAQLSAKPTTTPARTADPQELPETTQPDIIGVADTTKTETETDERPAAQAGPTSPAGSANGNAQPAFTKAPDPTQQEPVQERPVQKEPVQNQPAQTEPTAIQPPSTQPVGPAGGSGVRVQPAAIEKKVRDASRRISKADRLAIEEAMQAQPGTSAQHGLVTPGASRTHSGKSLYHVPPGRSTSD
ncbi:hypothetical protein BDZ85DRAFT_109404 [Elsinoe ampelina]|uniref:Uncharacterized protein n=1 Tax=Elsinoe ampelina TaxID=302913 RepID=A0A6A6GCS3_9PEZI|nr:hypothetical protein BDZ85DRAFT_109404 [Elsinoe ampelina]